MEYSINSSKKSRVYILIPFLCLAVVALCFCFYLSFHPGSVSEVKVSSHITSENYIGTNYGLNAEAFDKLAKYLSEKDFPGIGKYHVRDIDASLVLAKDARTLELENELQNAIVAAEIICKYKEAGYTEPQAYVAYVYGPRHATMNAIHSSVSCSELVLYCFGSNWEVIE